MYICPSHIRWDMYDLSSQNVATSTIPATISICRDLDWSSYRGSAPYSVLGIINHEILSPQLPIRGNRSQMRSAIVDIIWGSSTDSKIKQYKARVMSSSILDIRSEGTSVVCAYNRCMLFITISECISIHKTTFLSLTYFRLCPRKNQ